MICSVCSSTPSIRGAVDADIVGHLAVRKIAKRHGVSMRSVQRYIRHLPALLEAEGDAQASTSMLYVAPTTYNFNLFVTAPERDREKVPREEEGEGPIANVQMCR